MGDVGLHRLLIVDAGLLVVFLGVLGADLGHPVFQVIGRLVGATGNLHLDLQHGAELSHRFLPDDAELLHFGQQTGKRLRHVGRLEIAGLPEIGNRLQGLIHAGRVLDLRVLRDRPDHLRSFFWRRSLPDGKLGNHVSVVDRLLGIHAARYQLVDRGGQLVAADPVLVGGSPDAGRHITLLGGVGEPSLDSDVADDGLEVGRHLDGHSRHRADPHGLHELFLASLDAFPTLELEIDAAHDPAQPGVVVGQLVDGEPGRFEGVLVLLDLGANAVGSRRPGEVGGPEFLLEPHRFADDVLPDFGLVALLLQVVYTFANDIERPAKGGGNHPTDDDAQRDVFTCHDGVLS